MKKNEKNLLILLLIILSLTSCNGILNNDSNTMLVEKQNIQTSEEENQNNLDEKSFIDAQLNTINFMLDGSSWKPHDANFEELPIIFYSENFYIPISSIKSVQNRAIIEDTANKTILFQYKDISDEEVIQAKKYLDSFFNCVANGDFYEAKNYCTGAFAEIDIKNDDVFSNAVLIDSEIVQEYVDVNKELFFECTLKIKPTDYTKKLYGDTDTIKMYMRFDRGVLDGNFKLSGSGSGL